MILSPLQEPAVPFETCPCENSIQLRKGTITAPPYPTAQRVCALSCVQLGQRNGERRSTGGRFWFRGRNSSGDELVGRQRRESLKVACLSTSFRKSADRILEAAMFEHISSDALSFCISSVSTASTSSAVTLRPSSSGSASNPTHCQFWVREISAVAASSMRL